MGYVVWCTPELGASWFLQRGGWVNVYPVSKADVYVATCTSVFPSKEQADPYAGVTRIDCIRIEWEE